MWSMSIFGVIVRREDALPFNSVQRSAMQLTSQPVLRPHTVPAWKAWLPFVFLSAFFTAVHLIIHPTFGDDLFFSKALDKTDLFSWLVVRYNTWSSRLLLEAILVLVLKLPFFVWQVLDITMVLLLFYSLQSLLEPARRLKESMILALLFCCYPFFHMGSAGWVTTTVNYLWPASMAAYAVSGIKRWCMGEKLPWYRLSVHMLATSFACNNELAAVTLIAAYVACLLHLASTKQNTRIYPSIGLALALGSILFTLTTPGNAARLKAETLHWMPDFRSLTLLDKLRIGFVSTFEHFVSIPNAVLFLLCLLTCVQVFRENKAWQKRLLGFTPLIIQLGFSAFSLFRMLFFTHELNYSVPDIHPKQGMLLFQAAEAAAFFVMIAGLLFSLCIILRDRRQLLLVLLTLGIGLATRMTLSFSPTVLASGTRTYLFMYIALIAVSFLLWNRGVPQRLERFFHLTVAAGTFLSFIEVYLLQRKFPL